MIKTTKKLYKIKIIENHNYDELEKDVNEFLSSIEDYSQSDIEFKTSIVKGLDGEDVVYYTAFIKFYRWIG